MANTTSRYAFELDIKNKLQREGDYDLVPRSTRFEGEPLRLTAKQICDVLAPIITDIRRERIESVINERTFNVAVVAEGLCDMGNINAVLRSAESFGFLPIHILERDAQKYKRSERVSKGSEKWLDIHRSYDNVGSLKALKVQGYQIVATALEDAIPMEQVDFSKPTAVILGNEKDGVSDEALALSDVRAIIPTTGFTQSFNISVAASIVLYHVHQERRKQLGKSGDLTESEKDQIRAQYYLRTLDSAEQILRAHFQK